MPQVLLVLQEAAELAPNENEAPPEILEAKVEIFFLTCAPPHLGQVTSPTAPALRTSSSKSWSQVVQTNSKSGIVYLSQR